MNKRKASTDRNGQKQRAASRRPSANSLHARQNGIPKPEGPQSTHNMLEEKASSKMVSKGVDTGPPKTRFTPQDRCREIRSCSSPRLKYFPAEKIKKLNSPPPFSPEPIGALIAQLDPRDPGVLYVAGPPEQQPHCDSGQGDAAAVPHQYFHQHHQQHGMQTASQQQVPAQQQTGQTNPQSECALPQQVSNGLQAHRPFVPRDYFAQRNPPGNFVSRETTEAPQLVVRQAAHGEQESGTEAETVAADYEKQPVGGRNAAMFRRMVAGKLQPRNPGSMDPGATMNHQAGVAQQRACNPCGVNHGSSLYRSQPSPENPRYPENPQQVYQQLQQNMAHLQHMQQRTGNCRSLMPGTQPSGVPPRYNCNYQAGMQFPVFQGMTSPQDAMASQMRSCVHFAPHPQGGWIGNSPSTNDSMCGKGQVRPYSVEVTGGGQHQPLYKMPSPRQQFVPQQFAQQQMHGTAVSAVQRQQNTMLPPSQAASMNFSQQTAGNRQASSMNQQQLVYTNQQPAANQQCVDWQAGEQSNPDGQATKRKPMKFTVGMIRDQEKLLATMKQQGVPMDIMVRQFEALLNEQRKHLEYLERIRQETQSPELRRPVDMPRKRKQQEEKPEWMVHLTPPRLSYTEIERIHEQRRKEREAREAEMMQQQQQQQQQQQWVQEMAGQQMSGQLLNQPSYHPWQQAQWQQQQQQQYRIARHPSDTYSQPCVAAAPGNVSEPAKQMNYQQVVPLYRYNHQQPVQQQYAQYQQHPLPQFLQQPQQQFIQQHYNPQYQQQQQQQFFYQPVAQQSQEQQHNQSHPACDPSAPSTEPSSLLKMRLYKNEIRPQRRNNGLQDPEIAKKQLEQLRLSMDARRGLEYLVNLAPKKPAMKLNGIQERDEMEAEFQRRYVASSFQPPPKRVSANGLENARLPNNPPPQRLSNLKRAEQEFLREYPRQKLDQSRSCYSAPAERENGSVPLDQQQFLEHQTPCSERNPTMARGQAAPFGNDGDHSQRYQQMQQYYRNAKNCVGNMGEGDMAAGQKIQQANGGSFDRAGGDANNEYPTPWMDGHVAEDKSHQAFRNVCYGQANIDEARTIGGVRYLARKQDYLPSQQIATPEALIANRSQAAFAY